MKIKVAANRMSPSGPSTVNARKFNDAGAVSKLQFVIAKKISSTNARE